jgi:hypothetical protein
MIVFNDYPHSDLYIFQIGDPVTVEWEGAKFPAIVEGRNEAWQPGTPYYKITGIKHIICGDHLSPTDETPRLHWS